jgi:hypothetical protein
MQIKKTYKGINPQMLSDEIRGLVQKHGIEVGETETQTYGLPSGDTQTRIISAFKTQGKRMGDQKQCGEVHILGSPGGETRMTLYIDENVLPKERFSALEEDLDFILGSYELKW